MITIVNYQNSIMIKRVNTKITQKIISPKVNEQKSRILTLSSLVKMQEWWFKEFQKDNDNFKTIKQI